jgi:hypothetical protein
VGGAVISLFYRFSLQHHFSSSSVACRQGYHSESPQWRVLYNSFSILPLHYFPIGMTTHHGAWISGVGQP